MILATDVHYRNDQAKAVAVLFHWDDTVSQQVVIELVEDVNEYIPGEFYKRELPCIIQLLSK